MHVSAVVTQPLQHNYHWSFFYFHIAGLKPIMDSYIVFLLCQMPLLYPFFVFLLHNCCPPDHKVSLTIDITFITMDHFVSLKVEGLELSPISFHCIGLHWESCAPVYLPEFSNCRKKQMGKEVQLEYKDLLFF